MKVCGYKSVHDDNHHIAIMNQELFDGYASMYDLWIKNIKRNPDCNDRTKFEYTIPICQKCYEQWEGILYFFENSKQCAKLFKYYGNAPFQIGKNEFSI